MVQRRRLVVIHPQFQTSSPLKPLGQSKPKFYVEPPWQGGKKVYINCPGHMTKMAAMPIRGAIQNYVDFFYNYKTEN